MILPYSDETFQLPSYKVNPALESNHGQNFSIFTLFVIRFKRERTIRLLMTDSQELQQTTHAKRYFACPF